MRSIATTLVRNIKNRVLTSVLVFSLLVGLVPTITSQAATVTKKSSSYIDGAGGRQGIDIYTTGGRNKPGIIFVHGGGWRTGDKSQYANLGRAAAQRGYVAASIDYRLGSAGVYYQYEDVMRATKSIRANAASYGMNPNKIAIWGDSAGGSLAMRVAASGQSGMAAAVGWSAPVNAYTAIFNSEQSFAIGVDHSTCIPTDPNGLSSALANVPRSSGGTASNTKGTTPSTAGLINILSVSSAKTTTKTTSGSKKTISTSQLSNGLSQLIQSGAAATGQSNNPHVKNATQAVNFLSQSAANNSNTPSIYDPKSPTASKAVRAAAATAPNAATATHTAKSAIPAEAQRAILGMTDALGCQDNLRAMSPALNFARNTPPTFLANAQSEYLVHPGQAIEYSNNLRAKGIPSSYLILKGSNHMGYDARAVNPTFTFLNKYLK